MLAPYTEAAEGGPLLALGARSLALFDAFVNGIEADSRVAVGYERSGTLHVARAEPTLAHFASMHEELAQLGVAAELLSPAAARAYEPNLAADIFGGLLLPTQGLISAPGLTQAMVEAAQRRGAILQPQAKATRIRRSGARVAIDTDHGTVEADAVVLACGAWSGQVEVEGASGAVPVHPVRGQLLHLGWNGPHVARITWDEHCYLVPWRAAAAQLVEMGRVDAGNVAWFFHPGDFRVEAAPPPPHAIMYDPYSPAANPGMWTLEHFAQLRAQLCEPCTLTSYSRSTAVRVTLALAGFHIGRGKATGEKDETTVAATHRELLAEPLGSEWLGRVRRSTRSAPLREGGPAGPISEADFARLSAGML